jgi:putative inorganic carbon (hco3(-)) transporter
MFGTGLGHFIPIVAYLGFWIMAIVSLGGNPLYGLYYMIPFIPYRTMRDHFLPYPLGENMLTILVLCVIVGAILHGKRLPKSKLYIIWLVFGIYLYLSLWLGTAISNAPAPLSSSDVNFLTWKGYMLIPLIFAAAGLVIEDRKAVRTVVLLTAIAVFFIDRSSLTDSMSHSWAIFDEDKRGGGPLGFGSNQTAAYLAQFAVFFWGFVQFATRGKVKLAGYLLAAATIFTAMYCFSRAGYLAILFGVLVLGILKDRKLLLVLGGFLLVWQSVVPTAVRERVNMTQDSNGQLEASAQERVDLWQNAERSIERSPIVGNGFATFQLGEHVDNLKDTHNWYVKVLEETGIIGLIFALLLLQQMLAVSYRLYKRATDPLYRGLGLGLILAICACIVANFFGDRWTYIEITAPLWVLISAAIRAKDLTESESVLISTEDASVDAEAPYYA